MKTKLIAPMWKLIVRLEDIEVVQEEKSELGIIVSIKSKADIEMEKKGVCCGYIESVGPAAGYYQYWPDLPRYEFKVGQKVYIYRHSGSPQPDLGDGQIRVAINDVDIQSIIEETEE